MFADFKRGSFVGWCSQMIEHYEGMLLLTRNGKVGSAFTLARPLSKVCIAVGGRIFARRMLRLNSSSEKTSYPSRWLKWPTPSTRSIAVEALLGTYRPACRQNPQGGRNRNRVAVYPACTSLKRIFCVFLV